MNQEPPDLDAAEDAYLAALALSPDEPAALEGRQRVNDIRAERAAESALEQTVEDVWRQVATTDDLADRVRLIEVLQLRGVETDPDGVPTSTRLYQAQMDLAQQQFDNERYQLAGATAESALGNAPDEAARQEATNLLAQIYLAEGQRELDAERLTAARTLFERVLALQPQPAPDFVNQAQAGLNEVAQQETQLDNLQRIEQAWQSYDAAVDREDWNAAIAALDSITEITGPTPETVDFPSPPYDPRTYNITETRAQVRLLEGTRLQRAGNFPAARAQFQAVQTEPGRITQTTREAGAAAEARLNQAQELWEQVNAARAAQDWQQMREALLQLSELEGFGAQARNPQDGQTVGDLLALADSNLNQPTAQPTATSAPDEPTATSAPADTATPQPAETDTPAATDLPTTEPLPTETATPEPPTATATPEPPTATATLEPTATATATATATEEEVIQYETYTHPSGLFSIDVPTSWDTNQQGGDGVQVGFVSPSDEYGVTVAIVEAPADATQADLSTLVQEFAQDEFGSEDNFSAETPATEADGTVSLSFTYERSGFLSGTTTVPGTILARLDGDKLSYRIVLFQGGEEAQTPERTNVVMTMTNSFQIDPAVPLP
jgi:tetratricopeptide (TPR) repeat protein